MVQTEMGKSGGGLGCQVAHVGFQVLSLVGEVGEGVRR